MLSIFKNTLPFYFSLDDKADYSLTRLNHTLFPNNIKDIFPEITNADFLYTAFEKNIEGFLPLEITFATDNFALIKRYYNRAVKYYFNKKKILVEPTFIKDNQIWIRTKKNDEKSIFGEYDRYTIKVNFNQFSSKPELVLSFDRPKKVLKQSVTKFLSINAGATADLFNSVVYYETFHNEDKTTSYRMRVTKYEYLIDKDDIDYNNVYPILGKKLSIFLGFFTTMILKKNKRVSKLKIDIQNISLK